GGTDTLAPATAVPGQKTPLQPAGDDGSGGDRPRYVVDQFDDKLGEPIGGGGLACEEEGSGRDFQVRFFAQSVVEDHDPQHVEKLSLVLVNALHVAVVDRLWIDEVPSVFLEPVRKADLLLVPCFANRLAKLRIVGLPRQPGKGVQVNRPAVANGLSDGRGELRIGQLQPAPRRNSIRLVVEPLRE